MRRPGLRLILRGGREAESSLLPNLEMAVEAGNWPPENELGLIAARAVGAAIDTAGLRMAPDAELSLLFTDNARMQVVNEQWRGANKPTNVLSFPGSDIKVGETASQVLGDIIFAYETVRDEAVLDGKHFNDHLTHLLVHGMLHLFGYDHLNDHDAEIMETMERNALKSLGITDPYQDR